MFNGDLFGREWTLTLTSEEVEDAMRPIEEGDWGGHQTLAFMVQQRLRGGNVVTLTEPELDRAYKYAYDYGNGTWQKYSRAVVKAALRAGWMPFEGREVTR